MTPLAAQSGLKRAIAAALVLVATLWLSPENARADREHRVRSGQTLGHIAHRYHISIANLASANNLNRESNLREGQLLRIPDEGVVIVRPGTSLSAIAAANNVSVRALARANRLRENSRIQVGQRLVLPGHRVRAQAQSRWGRARHPGVVTLIRLRPRSQQRIRLVNRQGRVRPAAIRQLSRLMRYRGTTRTRRPPRRLIGLLARVSDHFGGRAITLVSGYRPTGGNTQRTSRHVRGHAIDIRVQGVPNRVLRDYVRTFHNVGVGFYPRSTFVHLDTRDTNAYWVDWARPGQAPIYRTPGSGPPESDPGSSTATAVNREEAEGENEPASQNTGTESTTALAATESEPSPPSAN